MKLFKVVPLCLFALLLLISIPVSAQVPAKIINSYHRIVKLIQQGDFNALSTCIAYPLNRPNPLPDIKNQAQFKARASILFDQAFVKLLKQYSDSIIFEHHGSYGLVGDVFNGQIWLNEKGKLMSLNYMSEREHEEKKKQTQIIKASMHSSVNQWDENVLVGRSGGLLIRVDRIGDQLRYASWSKGKTMDKKPDMVILNGKEASQGSMGGWTWSFQNEDWTYLVADNEICGGDTVCGYTLQLMQGEKLVKTIPLQLIK